MLPLPQESSKEGGIWKRTGSFLKRSVVWKKTISLSLSPELATLAMTSNLVALGGVLTVAGAGAWAGSHYFAPFPSVEERGSSSFSTASLALVKIEAPRREEAKVELQPEGQTEEKGALSAVTSRDSLGEGRELALFTPKEKEEEELEESRSWGFQFLKETLFPSEKKEIPLSSLSFPCQLWYLPKKRNPDWDAFLSPFCGSPKKSSLEALPHPLLEGKKEKSSFPSSWESTGFLVGKVLSVLQKPPSEGPFSAFLLSSEQKKDGVKKVEVDDLIMRASLFILHLTLKALTS